MAVPSPEADPLSCANDLQLCFGGLASPVRQFDPQESMFGPVQLLHVAEFVGDVLDLLELPDQVTDQFSIAMVADHSVQRLRSRFRSAIPNRRAFASASPGWHPANVRFLQDAMKRG